MKLGIKYVVTTSAGHKVWRGPRPRSHRDLKALAMTERIDLQSGIHERFHDDLLEKEDPRHFGMKLHDFSLSDFFAPSYKQVLEIMHAVADANSDVYIHCLHGKDRTGFVCACLRMFYHKISYRQAVKEMFDHGFHKVPYIWWLVPLYSISRKFRS